MRRGEQCRVCLGEHQRDIHAATVSIHEWLRRQVLASIQRPKIGKLRPPGGGPPIVRKRSAPIVTPRSAYVPWKLPVTVERIRELQAGGMGITEIARELGCSTDTVYGRLRGSGRKKGGAA